MADGLPPLYVDINAAGTPVVIVDGQEVQDVSSLVDLAPNVVEPKYAKVYSKLVNHLAHGYQFNVIMNPDAFEASYRERYAAEDPDEEPVGGNIRLHNYSLPDFSVIQEPRFEGQTLVFFAENVFLGVPYRVEVGTSVSTIGAPTYTPISMSGE